MRFWKRVILFLALALVAVPAMAEPRIALVIGNAGYRARMRPLANSVRDANVIASALRATGFDVDLVVDADRAAMNVALDRFRERLARAGPDATAFFFYAGHGMQAGETNYLAPVDAGTLETDAIAAETALDRMREGGARLKIIVLDACRDNPLRFGESPAGQGFGRMNALEQGRETFIAYSTAVGQTASDGEGDNSPFTAALARGILVPGRPIETTFREVRAQVVHSTSGEQTPWDSSSVTLAFSFAGEGAATAAVRLPPVARPPSPAPAGAVQVLDFETVPTAGAPAFMVAAQPYLRDAPVRLRVRDVVPAGSEVVFVNNRGMYEGNYAAPTLSQNMLTQFNTGNVAASYTLLLSRPARRVHVMIPRRFPDTASGVTAPAWAMSALGAGGEVLDSRHRQVAAEFDLDLPRETVTLQAASGAEITAIRIESDPRALNTAGELVPFAATSSILIEGIWVEG